MKIKNTSKGIEMSSNTVESLITLGDNFAVNVKKGDYSDHIVSPGEYEFGDLVVIANNSSASHTIDILNMYMNDVSVMLLQKDIKLTKALMENLSTADVIISVGLDFKNLKEYVDKLDVQKVLVVDTGVEDDQKLKSDIEKNYGIKMEEVSSITYQKSDFNYEEESAIEFKLIK